MLSIWKFVTSSSISGDSYTTKPNWAKIAAISAIASMLGWSVARRTGRPGVVTSTASAASRASRAPAPEDRATRRERRLDRQADRVGDGADPRTILGWERADPARDGGQPPLLAEDVDLERLKGCDVGRSLDRSQRLVPEGLQVVGQFGEVHLAGPGAGIRRCGPPPRSCRTSRHRGRRGRRGSSDRSRCRRASARR